jgi:hypothetical protein
VINDEEPVDWVLGSSKLSVEFHGLSLADLYAADRPPLSVWAASHADTFGANATFLKSSIPVFVWKPQ